MGGWVMSFGIRVQWGFGYCNIFGKLSGLFKKTISRSCLF